MKNTFNLKSLKQFIDKYIVSSSKAEDYPKLLTGETGAAIAIYATHHAHVAVVAESPEQATVYVTEDFKGQEEFSAVCSRVKSLGFKYEIVIESGAVIRTKYGLSSSMTSEGLDSTKKSANTTYFETLLQAAIQARAREIRFHVRQEICGVVFNIDGDVVHYTSISPELGNDLCSNAYTNMADPKSFEQGKGSFSASIDQSCTIDITVGGDLYRLRYQSMPEADSGYDVTMRIQRQGSKGAVPSLDSLGFTPSAVAALKRVARTPKGAVYATGPMGQGKTTTLYALMHRPREERNRYAMTFEDPPEYDQYGVTRVPVAHVGYANGVKRALRMGAHIVMIGEIRDEEMGMMAKVMSETGPKVFTTLHVLGANKCVGRLCGEEIKIPRQSLCDVDMVAAFFYQRLLPKLCDCAHKVIENPDVLDSSLRKEFERLEIPLEKVRVRNKKGCTHPDGSKKCNEGKLGGIPCIELIEPDEEYMRLMRAGLDGEAKDHWLSSCTSHITEEDIHGKPIIANALWHVYQGTIDVADVQEQLGLISKYEPAVKRTNLRAISA
jgi:general secretion pathway protein E